MRRKKYKKIADQALLDAIFDAEREWKHLRRIVENSIDPMLETEQHEKLAGAKYMFLLKEAKRRKVSVLQY